MNNQRKLNYSFRNRAPGKPNVKDGQPTESQPKSGCDPSVSSERPDQGPSYPSECYNEPPECQKLPDPDQPISAADLEHRKSVIRGKLNCCMHRTPFSDYSY